MGNVTVTPEELAAEDNIVELPISADRSYSTIAFGITWDSRLTYVESGADKGMGIAGQGDRFIWWANSAGGNVPAGKIGYVRFRLPEDAEDGETASNDVEATNPPSEPETGENGANTEPQEAEDEPEDKVIIPRGKMKVTVICDGSLNIRRSAAWGNENICGRAIRGQSYYVKEIHVVDGKKMVRTIGDLYLSGESEHVQFEQL